MSQPQDRTIISFDYAIKTVLRDKANFDVLEGFLSELLERKVTVLEILESESNARDRDDKVNRVDLKGKMENGELVIFEVQYGDQADFSNRTLFSLSKAVTEQFGKGDVYNRIRKVYSISIVHFDLGAKREYLFYARMLYLKGMHYKEELPFTLIEGGWRTPIPGQGVYPEYYLIFPNLFDEQIRNRFDEWMYVLKNSVVKSEFSAAGLQEAGEKLNKLKMTKAELEVYEKFLINRQSIDSAVWTAKAEKIKIKKFYLPIDTGFAHDVYYR